MVTEISIKHYCYNIDLYIDGILQKEVFSDDKTTKYEIISDDDTKKAFQLTVCQNDNQSKKLKNLFYYYEFGYEMGQLYFWPMNIYCTYEAVIKSGDDVRLCVSKNFEKAYSFIQNGCYIIENVSVAKAKKEHRDTLIPRNKRISFFTKSVLSQIVCNSMLTMGILLILMGFNDGVGFKYFSDGLDKFELICFILFFIYQFIRVIMYCAKHIKILLDDDGTYYQKSSANN